MESVVELDQSGESKEEEPEGIGSDVLNTLVPFVEIKEEQPEDPEAEYWSVGTSCAQRVDGGDGSTWNQGQPGTNNGNPGKLTCDRCRKTYSSPTNIDNLCRENVCVKKCDLSKTCLEEKNEDRDYTNCEEQHAITMCDHAPESTCGQDVVSNSMSKHQLVSEECDIILTNPSLSITREKSYVCHRCSESFPSSTDLSSHLKMTHGESAHACRHHQIIHSNVRPHVCQHCSKSYTRRDHLVRHLKTHSGERPHVCTLCSKNFSRGEHLSRHMRRTHTAELPYVCQQCSKEFSTPSGLAKHMKIHREELPHDAVTVPGDILASLLGSHPGEQPNS